MTDPLLALLQNIQEKGIEQVLRIFPGVYPAQVVSSEARPDGARGEIVAHCPEVHGPVAPTKAYFKPIFAAAGTKRGMFWPPEDGDTVYVTFQQGQPDRPGYYLGGSFGAPPGEEPDLPSSLGYTDTRPEKRGFRTRAGHELTFNDTPDGETVSVVWSQPATDDPSRKDRKVSASETTGTKHTLLFSKRGVLLLTASGNLLELSDTDDNVKILHNPKSGGKASAFFLTSTGFQLVDPAGGVFESKQGAMTFVAPKSISFVAGAGINLKSTVFLGDGALSGIPQGQPLLAWLKTHVHTSAAPGSPTTPPVVPPPDNIVSGKTRIGP